jgi:hypothetical protein
MMRSHDTNYAHDKFLVHISGSSSGELRPRIKEPVVQRVNGEIIDSKCYFGV